MKLTHNGDYDNIEKDADLVPKIAGVFKEMQKDGTLERLRTQFVGELLQGNICLISEAMSLQ